MTTDPKWLAVAALVGAGAAVLVLQIREDARRATADPAPAAAVTPASTTSPAPVGASPPPAPAPDPAPVPVAAPTPAPAPAPLAMPDPSTDPSLERIRLDDRQLAQHAREAFGFDCPEIVDRGTVRSGRYIVTCSNGTRLRVQQQPGLPRITLP